MTDQHENCPHCGCVLGFAGDAFCPECRNSLDTVPRTIEDKKLDIELPALPPSSLLPANVAGIVMIAVGFLPALGICYLLGDSSDGCKLVIGGPLTLAIDLVYRVTTASGHWLLPNRGGKFFFLPVWLFGVFWTLYGVWQLLREPARWVFLDHPPEGVT